VSTDVEVPVGNMVEKTKMSSVIPSEMAITRSPRRPDRRDPGTSSGYGIGGHVLAIQGGAVVPGARQGAVEASRADVVVGQGEAP
jgi:hypothetical protein